MVPPEGAEEQDDSPDMKKIRRNHPSGWLYLTKNDSVNYVLDALIDLPPGKEFNKTELADQVGISRESVRKHIELFLELGILEEVTGTSNQRYRLNIDGRVTNEVFAVNSAVNAARGEEEITIDLDPLFHSTPSRGEAYSVMQSVSNNIENKLKS